MKLTQFVLLFFFCAIISTSNASGITIPTTGQTPQRQQNSNVIDTILIAKWLNNATSAFTFTWDDNNFSHPQIAEILENYDFRGSFFVNPGFANWNSTKELYGAMASNGHEIGNHTWSHPRLRTLSLEDLVFEITSPIPSIQHVTNLAPISFIHPHNESNILIDSVVFSHHLFSRISSIHSLSNRLLRNLNSTTDIDEFSLWINQALNSKKWLIIAGHGIDGNGYQPVTSAFLHQTCNLLSENLLDVFWIGTLAEIAAYEYLKEELIINYQEQQGLLTISIEGFDSERYQSMQELKISLLLDVGNCNTISVENETEIRIIENTFYHEGDKQFIITFDLKTIQNLELHIGYEPKIFNLTGDSLHCTGEPGISFTLEGSEASNRYYLVRNEADTIDVLAGNDYALHFENITQEGTYHVAAIDTETGCWTIMDNYVCVSVYSSPVLIAPDDFEVCEGEEIILDALYENGSILWSDSIINGEPFIIEETQTFIAKVISEYGCLPAIDSLRVTVNPIPFLELPDDLGICEGQEVKVYATYEHGQLYWNNGIINGIPFIPIQSETYTAEVVSDYGCNSVKDSITIIVNPLPSVTLADFENLCKSQHGFNLSGGLPLGGRYYLDKVEMSYFFPVETGEYEIEYVFNDNNNCENSAFNDLTVLDCTSNLSFLRDNKLYPNPNSGVFYLDLEQKASITLFTFQGELIFTKELNSGLNAVTISELENGIYVIKIKSGDLVFSTKILKTKDN